MTQQTQTRKRNRHQERHPAHSYSTDLDRETAALVDEYILDSSTRPAPDYDPAAVIPPGTPLAVQGKRYFKLAPHQRTIPAHFWGRFGVGMEGEYGFKVLRDPRTGYPVVRDHGDLKPGEVSLVLE